MLLVIEKEFCKYLSIDVFNIIYLDYLIKKKQRKKRTTSQKLLYKKKQNRKYKKQKGNENVLSLNFNKEC